MAERLILGIDTATRVAGLAIGDQHRLWAEDVWYSVQTHTVELMPRLDRLMQHLGRTPDELAAVAVSTGPGSFTGLRIGISAAKGLVLSHRMPLLGIPTLEILALPHVGHWKNVWAVIQAGRGRLGIACYSNQTGALTLQEEPELVTVEQLADRLKPGAFVCGELEQNEAEILKDRWGRQIHQATPAENLRRPGFMLELAHRRLEAGEQDDPQALAPQYLQHPV